MNQWSIPVRLDLAWGLLLGATAGMLSLAASRPAGLWLVLPLLLVPLAWWIFTGAGRWVLAFLAAAVLLPPLPLPGGDSGPHPAVLVAALGIWAGVARLSDWRIRWTGVSLALGFFFFTLLASVPLAAFYSGWEAGSGSLARVGLVGIAVYLFFYVASGPGRDLEPQRVVRWLFWAALASAAFACLDFYFQFPAPARFAQQFVWLPDGVYRRAQGVFYEATTLGCFCVFALVMIAAIAVRGMRAAVRISSWWLAAAALVLFSGLAFSYSRSAMLSLVVALAALGWLERERFPPLRSLLRWALALAGCVAFGAVFVAQRFPGFFDAYLGRLWYSGEYLLASPGYVLAPRLESWRFLLDSIAENPWATVLGIGYKTLPYSGFLGRPVVADNMYLSLFVETGWMGLAALLVLNAAVLVTSYRQARGSGWRRFLGVWMFAFWCGQTVQMASGDILTYWRLLPLYFAVLALGVRADEDPVPRSI